MEPESVFEQMAEDRDALRPASGFNVVEIDDFNFPPETCISGHFDNLEDAVAAMEKLDIGGVVYDSKGEAVASKPSTWTKR